MLDSRDPSSLILRPFVGDPTAYVRIPVIQGICGTAAASGETVLTDDVNADPRFLSGSTDPKSASEIVVPIYAQQGHRRDRHRQPRSSRFSGGKVNAFSKTLPRSAGMSVEEHNAPSTP